MVHIRRPGWYSRLSDAALRFDVDFLPQDARRVLSLITRRRPALILLLTPSKQAAVQLLASGSGYSAPLPPLSSALAKLVERI